MVAAAEAAARSERWKAERVQAGVDEHMPERPKRHVCSLTHEAMIDPVIDALGNTYERAAIERWLRGHNTSPLTGAVLPHKELTPNIVLKSIIQEWEEEGARGVHGDGARARGSGAISLKVGGRRWHRGFESRP